MSNITENLSGLPMEDLIGTPLNAACKAQSNLARCMVTFINEIGIEADNNKARVLEFDLNRSIDNGTGELKQQKLTIAAPILGLVPVPALLIESIDVNFTMDVKSTTSSTDTLTTDSTLTADAAWGWGSASFTGNVTSSSDNTRTTDNSAKYDVSVKAKQQPHTESMAKLMDLFATAMEPIKVEPATV